MPVHVVCSEQRVSVSASWLVSSATAAGAILCMAPKLKGAARSRKRKKSGHGSTQAVSSEGTSSHHAPQGRLHSRALSHFGVQAGLACENAVRQLRVLFISPHRYARPQGSAWKREGGRFSPVDSDHRLAKTSYDMVEHVAEALQLLQEFQFGEDE
jgi:hypothetical protein